MLYLCKVMIRRTCKRCELTQDYSNFLIKNRKKEDSIGRVCSTCKSKNPKQTNEYWRQYRFNRRHIDPLFNFTDRVRSLIYSSVIRRKGYTKKTKTYEILGCSYKDFFNHIESQFTEGMTWKNIHLDHIKPLALGKTEKEVLNLCHYSNFQPLFANDNLQKGKKYVLEHE